MNRLDSKRGCERVEMDECIFMRQSQPQFLFFSRTKWAGKFGVHLSEGDLLGHIGIQVGKIAMLVV